MRVLQVVHRYRPAIGGVEQYVADLSETLARRGHSIDVATTRATNIWTYESDLSPFERVNGVDVRRFASLRRGRITAHVLRFAYDNFRRSGKWWFEPLLVAGKGPLAPGLGWHILRHGRDYDVAHIHALPFAHPVYAYYLARARGRPVVISPYTHIDQPQDYDLATYRSILRNADMLVALTSREASYLSDRKVDPDKILVAGGGVKLDDLPLLPRDECRARLGVPAEAFVLLFLARKEAYKGLGVLLDAFDHLQIRYPALHLISAGQDTSDSFELSHQYRSLARWYDYGVVSDAQKVDLLNAADVLVLPSTGESFGIVFLEAWAVRRPVIGVRAGAVPWVIEDGRDGLLAEPNDPESLATAIECLIAHPDLARGLAESGRAKVVERFTLDLVASRIEDGYRRVIAAGPRRTLATPSAQRAN